MRDIAHPDLDECCWRHPASSAIEIPELGLVYTGGSVLVRMRKSGDGGSHLAIGSDQARMLALLSVAFNRPVADVAHGTKKQPEAIGEYKTGNAKLTKSRVEQLHTHLPRNKDGKKIPVYECR